MREELTSSEKIMLLKLWKEKEKLDPLEKDVLLKFWNAEFKLDASEKKELLKFLGQVMGKRLSSSDKKTVRKWVLNTSIAPLITLSLFLVICPLMELYHVRKEYWYFLLFVVICYSIYSGRLYYAMKCPVCGSRLGFQRHLWGLFSFPKFVICKKCKTQLLEESDFKII